MINRAKMPRQLRGKGGITNVVPRTNYLFGGIKKRIRKLIPNELADVAVKAAPFVAMIPGYGPAAAGIMRGVGRFDQRGSLSDAFKQGLLTYGGGKLFGAGLERAGLRDSGASGIGDFFNQGTRDKASSFFKGGEESTKLIDTPPGGGDPSMTFTKPTKGFKSVIEGAKKLDNIPIIGELPNMVKQQILIGGVSGAATYVYEAFLKEEPPQEEGETYEEYMARRKENVGRKMKGYFDNYFKFDKDYSSMTDEQKQAFIDRVNVKDGGRIGYQTGGVTMANTLAENIRRNRAAQAAFNQMIRPTQIKASKITPIKTRPIETRPINITPIETRPIEIKELNLNRNPALNFFKPQQPLSLEDVNQTGMPRTITQDDIDTFNFTPPKANIDPMLVGSTDPMLVGFDYSKEINWSPGQPAPEGYRVVNIMGDEFLERKFPSKEEVAGLPMAFSGGGRVRFSEGANLKIKLKEIGYEDTLLDKLSLKELRELLDSEKGTFTGQGTYREPAKKGGMPTGIMKTNKAGVMERDYRDKGGFVPVGIKEKADDVPAMLSKNEFVFTADAVRGAGNGSIEKGAQRMYDTMKNLEKRVV